MSEEFWKVLSFYTCFSYMYFNFNFNLILILIQVLPGVHNSPFRIICKRFQYLTTSVMIKPILFILSHILFIYLFQYSKIPCYRDLNQLSVIMYVYYNIYISTSVSINEVDIITLTCLGNI